MVFDVAGNIDSAYIVSIDMEIDFATDGNKIYLPITDVLLCSVSSNLALSKKQQYWMPRNAALLLPFLTEAEILNADSNAGELLNIFACSVMERVDEGEDSGGNDNNNKDESKGGVEAEDKKTTKRGKTKHATAETLAIYSQMIVTTSWTSYRPSYSSHHKSPR